MVEQYILHADETIVILKGLKFGKAVLYSASQRVGIYRVLDDNFLELSNIRTEGIVKKNESILLFDAYY